jgi:polyhydroxybutyrate depolymerase
MRDRRTSAILLTALTGGICLSIAACLWADEAARPVAPRPSGGQGGETGVFPDEHIEVAGKDRAYRLIVPKSIDPSQPVPLVFAFHGFLDSKDFMAWYSKLDLLAEKHGFILVFPNGRDRRWPLLLELAKPDLAFFDALLDHLSSRYNIDLNRVYLTGMSNGAYFTHVVASQRADKVAAIAPHSGGLGLIGGKQPDLPHKYAVLLIHGEADALVGASESRRARDAYQKWGHTAEYIEVPKLNHFWAHDADINERIWKFFQEHPFAPGPDGR